MVTCKIDGWTIKLNKMSCRILVTNEELNIKKGYTTKLFKRDGMLLFPKELYRLICSHIKYANIYDRFLDKYYNWDESE